MKATEFLTGFALILFIKNINGQQNPLVYNENFERNNHETMQQPVPTYAIVKTIQDLMNQNENTAALPNNNNKICVQTNTPTTSTDTQRIRLPPDLQQQPLQVQQYLQLEKPLQLQQAPPLQQPLQLQPQTQVQPLTQSQLSFDTIQPLTPLQVQDILQLYLFQKQTQGQLDQPLQSYQPVQPLQSLELQQLQQSNQLQTSQPLTLQQPLQLQPQTQVQPLTQAQLSFDTIQPLIPLQAQDISQLYPLQKQPQLQLDQPLQSYQPVQNSLQLQQLQQSKQLQTLQPLMLQQPIHLQPQTQVQPLTQSQLSFDTIQPLTPLQAPDILQLYPLQKQPQLQLDQPLQSYQPVQPLQSLELQQLQQSNQLQSSQPLTLQLTLPSPDSLQPLKAMQQQPLGFQQIYPERSLAFPERKNVASIRDSLVNQNINNNQPNSQINVKWQSSAPKGAINIEMPYNKPQILNIQPRQTSMNSPLEIITPAQKFKPQETPSQTYYILSQPPVSPPASAPVVSNCPSVATTHTKPIEIPFTSPYQSTNTQSPYSNQVTNSQKNNYNNQNLGFRYPEQSTLPVALQKQPTASVLGQSSMLPSTPFSILQAPTISSQYAVSSGYPVRTIMAPTYTRNNSVSSSLKSILPLIFRLLKDKIATSDCNNDCPCECTNEKSDNELDVTCGYTNQKDYGHFTKDALPVLDTVSEEEQGPECLREPKTCEEIKNASLETSGEISEEEVSEEEEIDEDEEN